MNSWPKILILILKWGIWLFIAWIYIYCICIQYIYVLSFRSSVVQLKGRHLTICLKSLNGFPNFFLLTSWLHVELNVGHIYKQLDLDVIKLIILEIKIDSLDSQTKPPKRSKWQISTVSDFYFFYLWVFYIETLWK